MSLENRRQPIWAHKGISAGLVICGNNRKAARIYMNDDTNENLPQDEEVLVNEGHPVEMTQEESHDLAATTFPISAATNTFDNEACVFVSLQIKALQLTYIPKQDKFRLHNESEFHYADIVDIIASRARDFKILKSDVKMYFRFFMERTIAEIRDREKYSVAYSASADPSVWHRFLELLTGKVDRLDLAVLQHFIWQIKRKMQEKDVYHQMFLVLYGKQGSGKTLSVNRLTSPLRLFRAQLPGLSAVVDNRWKKVMADNYVGVVDEMSQARRVDHSELKNSITNPELEQRKLGSNKVVTLPNRMTLIGTSNIPLNELITDPTGNRRFWQITTLDKMDIEAVKAFDVLSLWQSIDPNVDSPISPLMEEIMEYQTKHFLYKTPVMVWLETATLRRGETMAGHCYTYYRKWCDWAKVKPDTETAFGIEVKRHIATRKTKYGIEYEITCLPIGRDGPDRSGYDATDEAFGTGEG